MSYDKEKYLANAKAIKEMLDNHQDFVPSMFEFIERPDVDYEFMTPEQLRGVKGQGESCGTAYCLAGYQANLANYPDEFVDEDGDFCHTKFSEAISGASCWEMAWDFIYAGRWPDTRESAYKRVNYIIENNGDIPPEEDWGDFE